MNKNITVITIIIIIIFIFKIPASAQTVTCPPKGLTGEGLISTPQSGSDVCTASGASVIDPKAAFLEIPTYNKLKSLYFTQKKSSTTTQHELSTGDRGQTEIPFNDAGDSVYHVNGKLTISDNNLGTHTGVVFVEQDLNFTADYTYGSGNTGTVFVVKGNINIDKSVKRIDAVLISEGIICTASEGNNPPGCPQGYTDPLPAGGQLVINGSLISIKKTDPAVANPPLPIRFRRTLADNTQAAELINHQVKYLVILRNTFSDTLQRWSEIQ